MARLFENFPEPSEDKPRPRQKKKKEDKSSEQPDPLITRRGFLKAGAAALGYFAAGGGLRTLRDELASHEDQPEETNASEEEGEERERATPEITGSSDLFDMNRETKLDRETFSALKDFWMKQYAHEGRFTADLANALERRKPWDKTIKDIYAQENVLPELRNIAIVESHWKLDARSPSGAVGAFQLMPDTARQYGLAISPKRKIDERKDPVKSGRASAQILKDIFEQTGDWNLSLAGYNGSYIWRYMQASAAKGVREYSFEGFLAYLEARINDKRADIVRGEIMHIVRDDDTLWGIGRKYGVNPADIKVHNGLTSNLIHPEQELQIPLADEKAKRGAYELVTGGAQQNVNYVAKVHAVLELLKESPGQIALGPARDREIG